MNKTPREKTFLLFLFFLALSLRVGYWIFLKKTYLFFGHPSDDVIYYQNWAQSIAFGETSRTSPFSGMPLFAYYLAVVFRICLGHWLAVNLFNLLLGSLNCVLIYVLAKQLFDKRTAVLAGLLSATNFILIYYDWLMMPVTLLINLSLVILLFLSDQKPKSLKEWFITGILIGLATLGDGKFLVFAVLFIIYLFWARQKFTLWQTLRVIITFSLGIFLILGAVTLRNKIVSGEWIFVSSQSGLSLYVGNNPTANGAFENPNFIRPSHVGQDEDQRIFVEKALGKKLTAGQISDFYRDQAIRFITTYPLKYVQLLGKKFVLIISDGEESHDIDLILQRTTKIKLDFNPYMLIFPLALIGMGICWQTNPNSRSLALLAASYLIYGLIYFVTTRQRAPILPVLILFEAYAFIWIAEKLKSHQYKTLFIPSVFFISFVFLFPPRFIDDRTWAFLNYSKTGSVHDAEKNYKQSSQAYLAALALSPADPNTLFNLGASYLNQNDYQKAKKYFLMAVQLGTFNVDAAFNLGYIYEQTGETQKALNAYQEVLYNTPDALDANFRVAQIYQKEGQCQKAKMYYEKILELKPILSDEIFKTLKNCRNAQ